MKEPLAILMRPTCIDEVLGQKHLVGKGKVLSNMVHNKKLFSMILYGRPGIVKTTLATAMIQELDLR